MSESPKVFNIIFASPGPGGLRGRLRLGGRADSVRRRHRHGRRRGLRGRRPPHAPRRRLRRAAGGGRRRRRGRHGQRLRQPPALRGQAAAPLLTPRPTKQTRSPPWYDIITHKQHSVQGRTFHYKQTFSGNDLMVVCYNRTPVKQINHTFICRYVTITRNNALHQTAPSRWCLRGQDDRHGTLYVQHRPHHLGDSVILMTAPCWWYRRGHDTDVVCNNSKAGHMDGFSVPVKPTW